MKREAFEDRWPKLTRKASVDSETHQGPMYLRIKPEKIVLALGGKLKQGIYRDSYGYSEWNIDISSRCFVHLVDAEHWKEITGKEPPSASSAPDKYPQDKSDFNSQKDQKTVPGSTILSRIKELSSLILGKR